MEVLMLGQAEVRQLLDPDALFEALSAEFIGLTRGQCVAPPRNEVQVPAGFLLGMPAWRQGQPISVKLVSVFHQNHHVGLPGHLALMCLFDPDTGLPLAVMDGTHITAFRTAAAAALSVRLLARPEVRVLAILGAGVQGREHLALVPRVREFAEVRVSSMYAADAERLAREDPRARAAASPEEAVRDADVVCLCTTAAEPVIDAGWLLPGAHVTSVGYMPPAGEIPSALVHQARLFVETRLAFEPPPVGCAELQGMDPALGTELGEVLLDSSRGRQRDDEVTLYKAMGHAAEDMAAAALVLRRASAAGIGRMVTL